MSTRVTAAADFVTEDKVPVTTAARVLQVSRQAIYDRMAPPRLLSPGRRCDWAPAAAG